MLQWAVTVMEGTAPYAAYRNLSSRLQAEKAPRVKFDVQTVTEPKSADEETVTKARLSQISPVNRSHRGEGSYIWANTSVNMESLNISTTKNTTVEVLWFLPGRTQCGEEAGRMINCESEPDSSISPSNHSSWPAPPDPVIHFHLHQQLPSCVSRPLIWLHLPVFFDCFV